MENQDFFLSIDLFRLSFASAWTSLYNTVEFSKHLWTWIGIIGLWQLRFWSHNTLSRFASGQITQLIHKLHFMFDKVWKAINPVLTFETSFILLSHKALLLIQILKKDIQPRELNREIKFLFCFCFVLLFICWFFSHSFHPNYSFPSLHLSQSPMPTPSVRSPVRTPIHIPTTHMQRI